MKYNKNHLAIEYLKMLLINFNIMWNMGWKIQIIII